SARRFTGPAGHNPRRKRTQNWIETGGNVSFTVEKTTSEIYDQYKKARGFVEMVERELDYCCSKATTRGL
ncbi:hypothetical protein NKJ46_08240, partial [Mesorhizobium sp. M0166]|uniref:hypothetical protein n=1 Tax=Mesorhizobium sp. M0166 TaxID=2956902 RepID=UPI003335EE99